MALYQHSQTLVQCRIIHQHSLMIKENNMLKIMDGTSRILYEGTGNIKEIYLGSQIDFYAAKIWVEIHTKLTKDYLVEFLFADNDSTSTVCKPTKFNVIQISDLCDRVHPYKLKTINTLTLLKNTEGLCAFTIGCIPKPWIKLKISEVASDGSLTELTTPIPDMYITLMYK